MAERKGNRNLTGIKSMFLSTVWPIVSGEVTTQSRKGQVWLENWKGTTVSSPCECCSMLWWKFLEFPPYGNQYMESILTAFLLEYSSGLFLSLKRTWIPCSPIVQSLICGQYCSHVAAESRDQILIFYTSIIPMSLEDLLWWQIASLSFLPGWERQGSRRHH